MKKLNIILFLLMTSICCVAHATFSKVIFFGDGLSDIGNNPGYVFPPSSSPGTGKAPVTNMMPNEDGSYRTGDTWVIPFVQLLKKDGLLDPNSTGQVVSSVYFDKSISVSPWDSLDFAYSGDPSVGYNEPKNIHQVHFLINLQCFDPDPSGYPPKAQTSNDLCGLYNRMLDFFSPTPITHFPFTMLDPNALYVIWIGTNDFTQTFSSLAEFIQNPQNTIDPYNSRSDINKKSFTTWYRTTMSIFMAAGDLIDHGAKYILVINLSNFGYTELGYNLNAEYANLHPSQPNQVNQFFTNFVNGYTDHQGKKWPGFDNYLNTLLNDIRHDSPKAKIYYVDINILYDMIRDGKVAAFTPQSLSLVNKDPVKQWFSYCCANQKEFDYDPSRCKPKAGYEQNCKGPIPSLPDSTGGGSYVFFNNIHPTTCTHKYIAAFVESYFTGKSFDPSINLCPEGY